MQVSIIIPVFNGQSHLRQCLTAIQQTHYPHWECIIVDDGSTDHSPSIITQFPQFQQLSTTTRSGPAVARNLGAKQAKGELLFFIDADVMIQPGTIGHAVAVLQANPDLAACFGSYDDAPSEDNLLSQYRNLQHHYIHQISDSDAGTFWSGCGMIRKHVFDAMGGFTTLTPGRPSIEDIELGYRLKRTGHHIRLEKLLLVKHLKRWTFASVLQTDIRDRAWPWTRLIVQEGGIPNDLNLQLSQRFSTIILFFGGVILLVGIWQPLVWLGLLPNFVGLFLLNRSFYLFLQAKRGWGFLLCTFWIHWLYFLYSGITFGFGVLYWGLMVRQKKING